jgi:type 1 glutamine amidotransferase
MHRKQTVRISVTLSAAMLFSGILLTAQQPAVPRSSAQPGPGGFLNTPGQNMNGMHIFLWAGLKSHGEGQHDYPQWLADWSKLLTQHGAIVDGALHPPSSVDLEHTDVLVIYKGDAAYLGGVAKPTIEAFVMRGGGIVSLHDSLCGPDPAYFATLVGGAKRHGDINYTLDAAVPYTIVDRANPIMEGMSDLTLWDEAFFSMTWADSPKVHVLATTVVAGTPSAGTHKGEIAPQIWTYEHNLPGGKPARAFVWMQGHLYTNFSNYQIQQMLLRGIAWASKQPVDTLVDYKTVSPSPHPASAPGP